MESNINVCKYTHYILLITNKVTDVTDTDTVLSFLIQTRRFGNVGIQTVLYT